MTSSQPGIVRRGSIKCQTDLRTSVVFGVQMRMHCDLRLNMAVMRTLEATHAITKMNVKRKLERESDWLTRPQPLAYSQRDPDSPAYRARRVSVLDPPLRAFVAV